MAKPWSGTVRRDTRTCRPLSTGKQSNCTCHCGERGAEGVSVHPPSPSPSLSPTERPALTGELPGARCRRHTCSQLARLEPSSRKLSCSPRSPAGTPGWEG